MYCSLSDKLSVHSRVAHCSIGDHCNANVLEQFFSVLNLSCHLSLVLFILLESSFLLFLLLTLELLEILLNFRKLSPLFRLLVFLLLNQLLLLRVKDFHH